MINNLKTAAVCICTAFVLSAPIASAANLDASRTALTSGQYQSAYEQASAIGTNDALLIAGEALCMKIMLGHSQKPEKDAKTAMAAAQTVLDSEPENADAKLLYALSYGYYRRRTGAVKAWRKKIPQKIRAATDDAIAANPDSPRAIGLLAGWHFSVSYKAGAKKAQSMFGASTDEGIAAFERALAADPDNIFILSHYALMLYASDAKEKHTNHQVRIKQLLAVINAASPQDATEMALIKLMDKFVSAPPKLALKIAKQFLAY